VRRAASAPGALAAARNSGPEGVSASAGRLAGHVLRGTVDAVRSLGVFVDVGDGIVGLVLFKEHLGLAEVPGLRSADRSDDFEVGADVVVLHIDLSRRRSLFAQADDSWEAHVAPPGEGAGRGPSASVRR